MRNKVFGFYIVLFTIYFSLPIIIESVHPMFILSTFLYFMIMFFTNNFFYAIVGQVLQVLVLSYFLYNLTVDVLRYFKDKLSD